MATGLFRQEAVDGPASSVRTDEEREALYAGTLDVLASCTWFLKQTHQSYHPMPNVRELAVNVMVGGLQLNAARFSSYWK